jgi:hypothetical protein
LVIKIVNKKTEIMSQLFFGSICLTDLIEHAKAKHSAFTKGQNGKVYASVNVWLNDEKDKFGNIMSIQLNPTKELKDLDKKPYIGNMKQSDGPKPISDRDMQGVDTDFDVPTRNTGTPATNATNPEDEPLPF